MERPPIVPAQIRAARAMLDWSQQQLADKAHMGLSTVRDYENERRGGDIGGLKVICLALEDAGVVFLPGEGDSGPGVRLPGQTPNVQRWPIRVGSWGELSIPVEWRGNEYIVLVSREILEDFGRFRNHQPERAYLRMFEEHRGSILGASARAIDAGRVTADRRVSLVHDDFVEFRR